MDSIKKIDGISKKISNADATTDSRATVIDLIPSVASPRETTKHPGRLFRAILYITIFCLTGGVVFTSGIIVSKQSSMSWLDNLPIFRQIKNMAESADRQLKGEDRDRVNILLLGMGGKNHDGGYLTDTIMLASLEPSTKKVALVSIPRDLAVPIENYGWRKINSVNAYAEKENPGSGGLAISQAVSKILNTPIDYYVRIDFQGFINIVDELGGVDVNVENTFDDYSYPVLGQEDAADYDSRYEHLHIEKGWQHMDGALALKYARSRHAAGAEGSDFARAKRQQNIIEAVKDDLLSANILFKPKMITDIIGQVQEHFATNLQIWEVVKLWDLFGDIKKENIVNRVMDTGPNGLLVNTVGEDGAYLLQPRSGDFTEIQYFVNTIFSQGPNDVVSVVEQERATVEVRNGTWINGLASKAALDLEKLGFTVVRIGNHSDQRFEKTVVYDLTYGEKKRSLGLLKEKLAAEVAYSLPEWLIAEIAADNAKEKNPIKPDFIIILGHEADQSQSGRENQEVKQ